MNIIQATKIEEILRLLDCKIEAYNNRNYGEGDEYHRKIDNAYRDFINEVDAAPYEVMEDVIKELKQTEEQENINE